VEFYLHYARACIASCFISPRGWPGFAVLAPFVELLHSSAAHPSALHGLAIPIWWRYVAYDASVAVCVLRKTSPVMLILCWEINYGHGFTACHVSTFGPVGQFSPNLVWTSHPCWTSQQLDYIICCNWWRVKWKA